MSKLVSKLVKAFAAAGLGLSIAGYAVAQSQNPNADTRPFPQDGTTTQPYDQNQVPTDPPEDPAVGSRPIGPPAASEDEAPDVAPEAPDDKNTTNLKKLDKQGRGGQQN